MESLTTQREALRVELAAVDEALERTESGSPERASVSAQQRVLSDQVADLNSEIGVTQATAVSPGRVLTDAQVPTSDIRLALYLAAGLLAGLVVGLLLAYVRERSDPRVRRASDVERLLDIPLLGYVPAGPSGLAPTASPVGQAFGRVRNRVLAALPESAALLVTGASPSRVNADVAVNTAAALARAGVPVTLVLADLQDEEVARMLQVEERPGLAEALLGLAEPTAVTVAVPGIPGLRVLTGGVDRAAAAELVQTRRLHTVLTRLRHEGVLLVHAPATSVSADAQAVASSCDAVVVTAEVARTRRGEVLSAARQLEAVGARLIGAVVAEHPLDLDDARHGTSSGRPAGSTAAPGRPALPVPRETVAVSSGSALAVPTGPLLRWPRRR